MNSRKLLATGVAAVSCLSMALAQAPEAKPKQIEPNPADVASMDSILKATYDVISGGIGVKRNWDRMRSLMVPDAKMGAAVRTRKGDIRYFGFSLDQYIKMGEPILESKGFFEHEISRHEDTYANISQVFSTYESRYKIDDAKPFERGVNSFQLLNDGKRWWVVSIYWQGEDDKTPVPDKWLGH